MANRKSRAFAQNVKHEPKNFWDIAIYDAEKQVEDAKRTIAHLNKSIESFRILRDKGEPFPIQNMSENEVKA